LKKQASRRTRKLLFLLPILAVVALVAFALFLVPTQGTLDVYATSVDKYTGLRSMSVVATVGSQAFRTPANLTLSPGPYTVTFSEIKWYATPLPRQVEVSPGKTVDADGVYVPIVMKVQSSPSGFGSSSVQALHGVTPVVWIDNSASFVTLYIQPVGRVNLDPGQNYTHVFTDVGSFGYQLYSDPSVAGVVDVT
jgi:plastocyanin